MSAMLDSLCIQLRDILHATESHWSTVMAKKPVKETITPPKKTLLTRESAKLRQGDPAAGRILSEAAQAARQKKGPKKR